MPVTPIIAPSVTPSGPLSDFERLFWQSPAALCLLTGPDLVYTRVNTVYQQLFPGRSFEGRPWREVFPELVAHPVHEALQRVYHTGLTHVDQNVRLAVVPAAEEPTDGGGADGEPTDYYFNYVFQAHPDPAGPAAGVLVFAYDVTQQVQQSQQALAAHAQLQTRSEVLEHGAQARNQALGASRAEARNAQAEADHEHARLDGFFKQTQAAICILNGPDHVMEYCNRAYRELFPGRELPMRPLAEVHPHAIDQGLLAIFDEVYRTGRPYAGHEVALSWSQPDGTAPRIGYFNFTCEAYREDGRVAGLTVFAYDATEQVLARGQVEALHLEREQTNLELVRTNADLDTFIYTASHDLRTPIANIEGLLTALREQLPPEALHAEQVAPLLDRMQESVERFQLTIAQLTDVAKLQQVHDQPAETVDLAPLVEDLRLDLVQLLDTSKAELTVDVAACPRVSFARQNLRSIVYNLLSNALKYRDLTRPCLVQLRCRSTDDVVVLDVQDNGLGLSEDQQAQLFGLFRRLHDHVPGTGIGLYMVKRLVENAGGTIAVQSQLGEGTTFTITLPENLRNG